MAAAAPGALGALAAAVVALWVLLANDVSPYVAVGVLPDVAAPAIAALGLWLLCGYGPARWLAPTALRGHVALLMFPVGAATSSLALAVLGLVQVPFKVSLALVIAGGTLAGLLARRKLGPLALRGRDPRAGGAVVRLAWPAYVLALVVAIALIPVFRLGTATVLGQNGDAVLATGTVEYVQHASPTGRDDSLPVDRVPLVWRSKLPIFYSMGAAATLSGLTPLEVFPTHAALVLALAALGCFLFAFYGLGAGRWPSLLVMGLVPLDRLLIYITDHPFYNQVWGLFALPFVLTFGLLYLRAPDRRSLGLFLLFAALGGLAYPLMLAFPAAFLVVAALVIRRRRRTEGVPTGWLPAWRGPRGRRALLLWVALAIVAVPVVAVLGRGVFEKVASGLLVVLPGRSLEAWSGAVPYFKLYTVFGLPGPDAVGIALLAALALALCVGLWRAPRDAGLAVAVLAAGALVFALDVRLRPFGSLFYFKDLGFLAPIALTAAVAGLAGLAVRSRLRWRRAVAVGAGVALTLLFALNAKRELQGTYEQATHDVRELGSWSRGLPRNASIRIDLPPSTFQLWTYQMLGRHRLSATKPLQVFFPYPPFSRRADYLLAESRQPVPADAQGPPVLQNGMFRLYRMKPTIPGPDTSSLRLVEPITKVVIQ
ncbi:MAG: hypothetical protein M3Z33_07490 [Actinomycetota bacterium]|nr:hypothetical protein [Actinomycetota bacterium]